MTKHTIIFSCLTFLLFSISPLAAQSISVGDDYMSTADLYKKNMKPDSAVLFYEKAAEEFQKMNATEKVVNAYNQMGIVLTRQDQYEKAKLYLENALSTGLASLDSNNLTIATTYISLGVIANAEENYAQALTWHHKALTIRLKLLGEMDPQVATSYGNIGNVYRNSGALANSIDAHTKAMQIRETVFGENSPEIIESFVGLGHAYREQKEYAMALTYFQKALANKIKQRGEGNPDLVKFYNYIRDVYYLMEDTQKGDEYKALAEAIAKKS